MSACPERGRTAVSRSRLIMVLHSAAERKTGHCAPAEQLDRWMAPTMAAESNINVTGKQHLKRKGKGKENGQSKISGVGVS